MVCISDNATNSCQYMALALTVVIGFSVENFYFISSYFPKKNYVMDLRNRFVELWPTHSICAIV